MVPSKGILTDYISSDLKNVSIRITPELPIIAKKNQTIKGLFKFLVNLIKFRHAIKNLDINRDTIIYCNTLATVACLFFFKHQKKYLHVHEILPNEKIIHKIINYIALKKSDIIIAVSSAVKNNLLLVGRKKIITLYNGISSRIIQKNKNQVLTFSLVGRLKPETKGQYVVIEAVKRLRTITSAKFIVYFWGSTVAGQEHIQQILEERIQNENLSEYIKIRGFTKNIDDIYSVTDIALVPSIIPDSLPTTAIEALSYGIPVIGSNIGGIPEIIDDNENGFLMWPGDYEDLARLMNKFITNLELITTFGKKGKIKFETTFSEKSFTQKINDIVK